MPTVKIPPPPPPPPKSFYEEQERRKEEQRQESEDIKLDIKMPKEKKIKKFKEPMSRETKMSLLISGATACFFIAAACIVLMFVL